MIKAVSIRFSQYTIETMPFQPFVELSPFLALLIVALVLVLMRPRRFYFVRHGETVLNAQHIRQGAEGALSESGREQAETLGRYLKRFHIKCIISSPYERTKETAQIINTYLKVPVIYSALLVERRNPKEIIGKHRDSPEVVRIIDQMDLAYHADDYRFSDEENFVDLKMRAHKCLDLLAHQGVCDTIVVTHHIFLKMFIAYLLYRDGLHAADFAKLAFFNFSDNATVTICEFHPWKIFNRTRGWAVVSYNERPE